MFDLGDARALWDARIAHPDVFLEAFKRNSLKPAGHAMAWQIALEKKARATASRPLRVLEIGHGSLSPFFEMFSNDPAFECHGLDDTDKDQTVSTKALAALRQRYTNCRFHIGYLGNCETLPTDYFDLVFSVSVIEHVPKPELSAFHKEIYRILAPAGEQFHSYDVPWGIDTAHMREAIEVAGFGWVETPKTNDSLWSSTKIHHVLFENAFVVTELFQHATPMNKRRLYNWTTVFMRALKPTSQSGRAVLSVVTC
jgi:ubiquinone/menaquinone biosynthesis C-methylase UbiE